MQIFDLFNGQHFFELSCLKTLVSTAASTLNQNQDIDNKKKILF